MTDFQAPPGVELDIGNLIAFDHRVGLEGSEQDIARQGAEVLVRAIFSLPATSSDEGRFVTLPKPTFDLPREKPIPKERTPTKWEQFAKEKGIQKKKRDRLVLDEATGEYVPRYGRNSKNALDKDVIIPHKEGMGDDYDPFSEKRKEKKKRIQQNKKQNLANIGRAAKRSQLDPIQALDVAKTGASGKKYFPKSALKDTLAIAQKSTASAGRFDKKMKNEPKQKTQGRKKKYGSSGGSGAVQQEKQRSQKIADRILIGKK